MVTLQPSRSNTEAIQKLAPKFSARIPIMDDPEWRLSTPDDLTDYILQRFRTEAKLVETPDEDVFLLLTGPNADEQLAERVVKKLSRKPVPASQVFLDLAEDRIDPRRGYNYYC